MAMIPAKCTNCGANIQVDKTKEAGICESCGTAFITEKAINNYNINLENVIINSDTVNISHSTNLLDLSAIEKLLKNGLYDDAKKRLEVLIKDFPDNYRVWFEDAKFDYIYNDIWLDDNPNFIKSKALAGKAGNEEITIYRNSEHAKIIQNSKKLIDFCNNIDVSQLDCCYINAYGYAYNDNHDEYIGLEMTGKDLRLVRYRKHSKFGYIRYEMNNNITIKPKIKNKRYVGQVIIDGSGETINCTHIKYPEVHNGKRWISCGHSGLYISDLSEKGVVFNEQESEMYYSNDLKAKSTDFEKTGDGCYIATAVYGSYDCPPVWMLRRYRDETLASTWYGRAFIHIYYAISPTLVKWFGDTVWFKKIWKGTLDKIVDRLQANGIEDTPHQGKKW